MGIEHRIATLARLGESIKEGGEWLDQAVQKAYYENRWFTIESSRNALNAICSSFLDRTVLEQWVSKYKMRISEKSKRIGLVLAGNIPLVGFHDILCTYIQGHTSVIKMSSKDSTLIKAILEKLIELSPGDSVLFVFTERLSDFDAVIATGSNNSSKYFESYFGKYPNIIRKSRNSVGVLTGEESEKELLSLGGDIFQYFGLGCRNVSKVYLPREYQIEPLIEVLHEGFKEYINHNKYKNNYDYNYALFMLNKEEFLMSGSLLFKKSEDIASRIACLHYDYYDSIDALEQELTNRKEEIQCVVSSAQLRALDSVPFGYAQSPKIDDYADGVDTMEFLTSIT